MLQFPNLLQAIKCDTLQSVPDVGAALESRLDSGEMDLHGKLLKFSVLVCGTTSIDHVSGEHGEVPNGDWGERVLLPISKKLASISAGV